MDPLLQAIIERRKNFADFKGDITLASDSMAMLIPCLDDGACQLSLHEDTDAAGWMMAVKKAQTSLTHTSADCIVLGSKSQAKELGRWKGETTPGARLDYHTIMSSINEDRDEDVMHPKGANLDPAMPVLYHHNPVWVIGTYRKEVARTSNYIEIHNSLADTVMGNDAAVLVEHGALRTSHGFKATKFKERKGSKGYEIFEYDVYENSLTGVPSNKDAVITLWGRGLLKHAANLMWGKSLKDGLPKQVVGGFEKTVTVVAPCECGKHKDARVTRVAKMIGKAVAAPAKVGYDGTLWVGASLTQSWEWVSDSLEDQAKDYLKSNNVKVGDYASCCVMGTYDDYAVVCVMDAGYDPRGKSAFYKIGWSLKDGEPTLSGTPEAVDVSVEHSGMAGGDAAEKFAAEAMSTKLLKMQIAKLTEARDHMAHVKASPELKVTTKKFADDAHGLIHSVINSGKSGLKVAKMTIAKLSKARDLAKAVKESPELKVPAKAAADAAHSLLVAVMGTMKSATAREIAADLCLSLGGGDEVDAGVIAALREEIDAAEGRILDAELAAL